MSRAFLLATGLAALSLFTAPQSRAHPSTAPLLTVARQLEDASQDALRHAERAAHRGAFSERLALDELHRFAARSRDFRRVLRRDGSDSRRTRQAYLHLVLAHHDVRHALAGLPVFATTRRELLRVDELMWRLRTGYRARPDRHHDRYERRGRASIDRYGGESGSGHPGRGR